MPSSIAVDRQIVSPGIDRLLTADRGLIAGKRVGLRVQSRFGRR